MKKDLSLFAKRLRKAREEVKMSQLELGTAIGVSDKSISAYEQDRAIPPVPKLKLISDVTHQPLHYFTDQEYEPLSLEEKLASLEKELEEVKAKLAEQNS